MNERAGYLAMYPSISALTAAMVRLRADGREDFEVFMPFHSEEVDHLLPGKRSGLGWAMLIGGLIGAAGAYFLQWYACRDYPVNVGGRPLHSWPSYIPVTFELTVLTASFVGLFGLLWCARLPRLDYPTFNSPHFARASQDRYFLWLPVVETSRRAKPDHELLNPGAETVEEIIGP